MTRLRGPDGCPWDRAQGYDSVKALLLEEAYEVVDAVNSRDFDAIEEELGDVLFQVVFYSRLAEEENRFNIDDVIEKVHAKLIRRHPHVFGDVPARTPQEALARWNAVKEAEKLPEGEDSSQPTSLLDGMPRTLPSTLEAYELGVRVAEVGFDWAKVEDLLDKVEEELRELRCELKHKYSAASTPDRNANGGRKIEEEVGDLMFTVANLARFLHFDPETCLRSANQKFKRRFQFLEKEVFKHGKKVRECSLQELESIWTLVKTRENK